MWIYLAWLLWLGQGRDCCTHAARWKLQWKKCLFFYNLEKQQTIYRIEHKPGSSNSLYNRKIKWGYLLCYCRFEDKAPPFFPQYTHKFWDGGTSRDKSDLHFRSSKLKMTQTTLACTPASRMSTTTNILPLQPIPEETHFRKVQNFWFGIAQLHEAF